MYYRCNAGGWNRSHGQVEQTPRLDSFELPMGKPWEIMYCGCPDRGDKPVEVDAEGSTAHLYLTGWRKSVTVKLSHKPNGYGGKPQTFFLCPQCGERVRYLYLKENHFLCRKCARLNYRSQQRTEGSMTYYEEGMDFVNRRLKFPEYVPDGFSFVGYVPEKPPGMWRKTYHRYLARFFRYRNKHTQRLIQDLARITGKFK